jgi:hypothetical protein
MMSKGWHNESMEHSNARATGSSGKSHPENGYIIKENKRLSESKMDEMSYETGKEHHESNEAYLARWKKENPKENEAYERQEREYQASKKHRKEVGMEND